MRGLIERVVGLRAGIEFDTAVGASDGVAVRAVQGGQDRWDCLPLVSDAERRNRRFMFLKKGHIGRLVGVLSVVWFGFALVVAVLAVAPAQAEFGLKEFDVAFEDEEGGAVMQAGSHPFAMKTSFEVNTEEGPEGGEVPDGEVKDMIVFQIPGFVGNPTAVPPVALPQSEFIDNSTSALSAPGCSSL